MSAYAQLATKRIVRLVLLGMCFFCLLLLGLHSYAETTAQASATKNYMLWPLLPGETLQSLATQLYPQSPILQQRFIQRAITLSRHHSGSYVSTLSLSADTQFERPQLIAVPHEQALTALTHRIKKAEELVAIQNTVNPQSGQPFSDHRLSFQLSASPKLAPQPQNKTAEVSQTETDTAMPKIVFEEPVESSQVEGQVTTPAEKEAPSVAVPIPISTPASKTKAPSLNQTPSASVEAKLKINLSAYLQTARTNLQANLRAFKQGNLNDWLRHPQLKWLCFEGIVLLLLMLYAWIEMRLKRRESLKEVS